jgi:HemY protein
VIRALVYLAILGALSLLAASVADTPGAVTLDWLGYRIETSVLALLIVMLGASAVIAGLWRVWSAVTNSPRRMRRWQADRRQRLGYKALTQGMVAVAAGDAIEARRLARKAEALLGEPPLTMLLSAQAAQLSGDEKAAGKFFHAMAEQSEPETRYLGLHGMLTQAMHDGDQVQALELAKQASELKPKTDAVTETLFDLQVKTGDWTDAEDTVKKAVKAKHIDADAAKRRRAVLAYQQSIEAQSEGRFDDALDHAKRAVNLSPSFVPAAVRYADLLNDAGKRRRAVSVIEETWVRQPHPHLAAAMERLAAGGAEDRLHAIERLAGYNREHEESHIALARAALASKRWSEAREHLESLARTHATSRVARLMAELEEGEKGDTEASRAWLKRATTAEPDAAWVCDHCGNVVADWEPVCGRCETFDGFFWMPPPRVTHFTPADAPTGGPEIDGGIDSATDVRPDGDGLPKGGA